MSRITRRAAIGLVTAGGAMLGLGVAGGYLLRDALEYVGGGGMMGTGMMGSATQADMSSYTKLFDRHTEIKRTVEEIDGGVRLIRSEEHTSELQSRPHLVCRLLLEKKNNITSAPHQLAD